MNSTQEELQKVAESIVWTGLKAKVTFMGDDRYPSTRFNPAATILVEIINPDSTIKKEFIAARHMTKEEILQNVGRIVRSCSEQFTNEERSLYFLDLERRAAKRNCTILEVMNDDNRILAESERCRSGECQKPDCEICQTMAELKKCQKTPEPPQKPRVYPTLTPKTTLWSKVTNFLFG